MLSLISAIARMATKKIDIRRAGLKTMETLNFDNKVLKVLPLDKEKKNFVRQVENACFSLVSPTKVDNPQMVAYSTDAINLLDLSEGEMKKTAAAEYFCGNKILPGSQTAAHCYCGHQFGAFSGQLGDGAVIYLGEVVNSESKRWELQLKGAGPTPYSRHADGRKVLRSSVREFLCSEAMHYLGIPTTRAATIVSSDSFVRRDKFYDGNAKDERCTVVSRLSPTFIRFGSFEICNPEDSLTGRSGPSEGNTGILKILLDYVIETHFPEIWLSEGGKPSVTMYLQWLKEVVKRTAHLVAGWQCVGWCHGVLNTDNMSIIGVTIDYGPFGFVDRFDPEFICNSSDEGGRYSYSKQPEICKWNCEKLAFALKDHIPLEESLKLVHETFEPEFNTQYMDSMKKKMGIIYTSEPVDADLVESFLSAMHKTGGDFTNSWRVLSTLSYDFDIVEATQLMLAQCCSIDELRESLKPTMNQRELQMMVMIAQSNPGLLQHLGRGAMRLMKELNNLEKMKDLQDVTDESKKEKDKEIWKEWFDRYHTRLAADLTGAERAHKDIHRKDQLLNAANQERLKVMNSVNPRFVLRNHLAEDAISRAELDDFSGVRDLLEAFKHVWQIQTDNSSTTAGATANVEKTYDDYEARPPTWAASIKVS